MSKKAALTTETPYFRSRSTFRRANEKKKSVDVFGMNSKFAKKLISRKKVQVHKVSSNQISISTRKLCWEILNFYVKSSSDSQQSGKMWNSSSTLLSRNFCQNVALYCEIFREMNLTTFFMCALQLKIISWNRATL